ncbi:unnamed protein product [Ranitomeya imitator]|uniref:U3 small nucleolar RNA-associated protein NOL7 C-terminal domain-containing protein n=1 Tax=Ranitomeya imitator TaxID=111125 RepID=A0ABN9LGW5_9NEOB|nr:unnamed protein product [Ranitomeya imitator]
MPESCSDRQGLRRVTSLNHAARHGPLHLRLSGKVEKLRHLGSVGEASLDGKDIYLPLTFTVAVTTGESQFIESAYLDSGAAGNFILQAVVDWFQIPVHPLKNPLAITSVDRRTLLETVCLATEPLKWRSMTPEHELESEEDEAPEEVTFQSAKSRAEESARVRRHAASSPFHDKMNKVIQKCNWSSKNQPSYVILMENKRNEPGKEGEKRFSMNKGRAKYACAGAVAEDQKRTSWKEDRRRRSGPETPIRPDQQRDRPWVSNIGGLSTALQNAADKPLMPVGLPHPGFSGEKALLKEKRKRKEELFKEQKKKKLLPDDVLQIISSASEKRLQDNYKVVQLDEYSGKDLLQQRAKSFIQERLYGETMNRTTANEFLSISRKRAVIKRPAVQFADTNWGEEEKQRAAKFNLKWVDKNKL